MTQHQWTTLQPLLVEATVGLFASNGLPFDWTGEPLSRMVLADGLAAVIGFTGEGAGGSLTLAVERATLRSMFRRGLGGEPDEADLRDWLRELSNQLLGRFKNQALDLSLRLQVGIPTCLVGRELECPPGKGGAARRLLFTDGEGVELYIFFEAVLDPMLTLSKAQNAAAEPTHLFEGGMLLFE